jgi:hypothetical protein
MKRALITFQNPIVFICLFIVVQTSFLFGADEITGLWEIKMDFGGRFGYANLSVSKTSDDKYSAKWGSDELTEVKFQDGKLTFVRTVGRGERKFTSNFDAALKDDKLIGTMTNNWGQTDVICIRPKPICPATGRWDMKIALDDRTINGIMIISKKSDGALTGQWTKEPGEHEISNVNFKDGKLSFDRHVKISRPDSNQVFEFDTPFKGTVEGDRMTGIMKNEMGTWQVTGDRIGTELIGTWEVTTTSEWGTHTQLLKIYPDWTGRYEVFGSFLPVSDLSLENDKLLFTVDMSFGDNDFYLDFEGTLKDNSLTGLFEHPRGESQVTGKKLPEKTVQKP